MGKHEKERKSDLCFALFALDAPLITRITGGGDRTDELVGTDGLTDRLKVHKSLETPIFFNMFFFQQQNVHASFSGWEKKPYDAQTFSSETFLFRRHAAATFREMPTRRKFVRKKEERKKTWHCETERENDDSLKKMKKTKTAVDSFYLEAREMKSRFVFRSPNSSRGTRRRSWNVSFCALTCKLLNAFMIFPPKVVGVLVGGLCIWNHSYCKPSCICFSTSKWNSRGERWTGKKIVMCISRSLLWALLFSEHKSPVKKCVGAK